MSIIGSRTLLSVLLTQYGELVVDYVSEKSIDNF